MNSIEILSDLTQRPVDAAKGLPNLTADQLNAHTGDHPNSIAWLLWHSGREVDAQLADLTGDEQRWESFRTSFNLGDIGDSVGLGHTPAQAAEVAVDDQQLLVDYLEATLTAVGRYVSQLSEDALGEVIDENWTPPVTRGVRLISIIDDAIQHVGQAAYAAGALTKPS
ncbi:MAG: DinB family protein [Brevibacterium sp.]|uniref:mycothiol transferase n=1 Tax=Brevibacterium sp. TaxID=1701 RepID=UPI0026477F14|nr:DinB family protein [Brevibacterium sp.]MDN5806231.1 DinB family protein [Brevibacterium sp.]MDN5832760.1 DinB family protein [Brevibacterium sp.]MDN5875406.1 DinB family protein [Brevibacterium sp.]MDN5908560.1 DinB family protein [Brevibacterium sp.]MDN6133084.1 DinB family protein [Brevibacterium sp.]